MAVYKILMSGDELVAFESALTLIYKRRRGTRRSKIKRHVDELRKKMDGMPNVHRVGKLGKRDAIWESGVGTLEIRLGRIFVRQTLQELEDTPDQGLLRQRMLQSAINKLKKAVEADPGADVPRYRLLGG